MKKFTLISTMFIFVLACSCANSGAKSQTWAPRQGKPMKRGHNNHN